MIACFSGTLGDRIASFGMVGLITTITLALSIEGFGRPSFADLPLTVLWIVGAILAASVAIAVWIEDAGPQPRIETVVVVMILTAMNSILYHKSARALRDRDVEHWRVEPGEPIVDFRSDRRRRRHAVLMVGVLLLVGALGTAVVLSRDLPHQIVDVGAFDLMLALMFVLFQAPDVALSRSVIGAVALPRRAYGGLLVMIEHGTL